jgi:hypothetical protein
MSLKFPGVEHHFANIKQLTPVSLCLELSLQIPPVDVHFR